MPRVLATKYWKHLVAYIRNPTMTRRAASKEPCRGSGYSESCPRRWFENVTQKDKSNLQRIVNISTNVTGLKQSSLTDLYRKQVLRKATKTLMTILIFYITSMSFCPRQESLEPSHPKQLESVVHLFKCLYDFSTTAPVTFPWETRQSVCVYVIYIFCGEKTTTIITTIYNYIID